MDEHLTTDERLERTIKHLAHTIKLMGDLTYVVEMLQVQTSLQDDRVTELETRLTMRS